MNIRVKIGDQIFDVEVGDLTARPILATVEGETFEVWPEEEAAAVPVPVAAKIETAPAAPRPAAAPALNGDKKKQVTAPIPGVIISVSVKPGDRVSHGQELCMLEAMKMKNAIRANREGTVAAIHIAVGDHVRQGQPLVEYTD